MGKDPATLWYWNDWVGGTMTLTRQEKGAYMDLLTAQFNSGHLTETQIRKLLGNDQGLWGTVLREKFVVDSNGSYFNQRLEDEINKRKAFVASRGVNGSKGGRPKKPYDKPSDKPYAKATDNLLVNENGNKEGIGGAGEKEGVPIGSDQASIIGNKAWNDQRWVANVCMGNQLKPDDLLKWMAQFNASICNDVMPDFSESKYKKIFGGWLNTQRSKGYKLPDQSQTTPQSPTLKIPELK